MQVVSKKHIGVLLVVIIGIVIVAVTIVPYLGDFSFASLTDNDNQTTSTNTRPPGNDDLDFDTPVVLPPLEQNQVRVRIFNIGVNNFAVPMTYFPDNFVFDPTMVITPNIVMAPFSLELSTFHISHTGGQNFNEIRLVFNGITYILHL